MTKKTVYVVVWTQRTERVSLGFEYPLQEKGHV